MWHERTSGRDFWITLSYKIFILKGTWSQDTSWPENLDNEQILHLQTSFCFSINIYTLARFVFLFQIWAPRGIAMLVCSGLLKSWKGLADDLFDIWFLCHTCQPCSWSLCHGLQILTAGHKMAALTVVSTTFKYQFLWKQTGPEFKWKTEVWLLFIFGVFFIFYSIPPTGLVVLFLLQFPFKWLWP